MVDDAPMHRLWYDLRSQALFEASFRDDVLEIDATLEQMIWQVVSRYAELRGVGGRDAVLARATRCSTGCSSRRCSGTSREWPARPTISAPARQLLAFTVT